MHVDCTTCPVRGSHCPQCVVSTLLALPAPRAVGMPGLEGALPLDRREQQAVGHLVAAGLVTSAAAAGLVAQHEGWGARRAG